MGEPEPASTDVTEGRRHSERGAETGTSDATSATATVPSPSLARNFLLNSGARGLLIFLSLASTPVVVHRLGTTQYGVYVLALTLGGLFNLLDFGISPAVIMLLSRAWRDQDHELIQRILSSAFALFLGIGLVGGTLLVLLVPWMVVDLLRVPVTLRSLSQFSLWLSAAAFTINMSLSVFSAVPVALERYDLASSRVAAISLTSTLTIIIACLLGGGLRTLMIINIVATVFTVAVFYRLGRRLLPAARYYPSFHRSVLRELGRFSIFKFAGNLGGTLTFRFDQFAIAALAGVGSVGLYVIPANATLRAFAFLTDLVSPFFPRASKLKGDVPAVRSFLLRNSRALALVSTPALVTLFVFADFVLLYWIGGHDGRLVSHASTSVMRWLIAAFLIQSLATVPAVLCEGLGRPEINNGFSLAGAILHVPLVLVLVPFYGPAGAAIALFLNSATQTVTFIVFSVKKIAGMSAYEFFLKSFARPLTAAGVAGAAGMLMRPFIHNLFALLLAVAVMWVVYPAVALAISAVTSGDVAFLARAASRLPISFPGRQALVSFGHRYEVDAR